jgi:uncharacterized protein (TIGR02569 family)
MSDSPPAAVLEAFGVAATSPTQLPGGEGKAWHAGDLVLKPERQPDAVIAWLATSVEAVADTTEFRMSRHLSAADGRWVVDGWSAVHWLEGEHRSDNWDDRLGASRAFHAAIAGVSPPPADLPWAETQWRTADKVAWNEADYEAPANVQEVLDRLKPHLDAEWTGAPPQVVHGDVGGKVLFADNLPPAIIDMSPYVRPAEFASAVLIVDAIAWEGAPLTLAIRFSATVDGADQLLARAVAFRLIAAAEGFASLPERIAAEVAAYRPVLSAVGP